MKNTQLCEVKGFRGKSIGIEYRYKFGLKSIADTASVTFHEKYRRYRYRYSKSIADSIAIDTDNRY